MLGSDTVVFKGKPEAVDRSAAKRISYAVQACTTIYFALIKLGLINNLALRDIEFSTSIFHDNSNFYLKTVYTANWFWCVDILQVATK